MTDRLKAALRDLAAGAPEPADVDVWPAAVRRRRLRSAAVPIVVILAVVAIILGTMSFGGLSRDHGVPSKQTGAPSVPRHIGLPWIWQTGPQEDPPGPVSVIFSGHGLPLNTGEVMGSEGNIGLVGASEDSYRLLLVPSSSGVGGVALSPNGNLLAISVGNDTSVINLSTGMERRFSAGSPQAVAGPLGWLPDGRTVVVSRYGGENSAEPLPMALVDTTTGASRTLPYSPQVAAASPDGTRVAVGLEREIFVAPTAAGPGRKLITAGLHRQLAGSAAWSPDGRTVVIADAGSCENCLDGIPGTWTLGGVDAVTGAYQADLGFSKLANAIRVSVLGWRGPDVPVVAVYRPDNTVEVLALRRGGKPDVVVGSTDGISNVAVASDLLASGAARPGADAPPLPMRTSAVVTCVVVPAVLVMLVWWAVRRRRRTARTS